MNEMGCIYWQVSIWVWTEKLGFSTKKVEKPDLTQSQLAQGSCWGA